MTVASINLNELVTALSAPRVGTYIAASVNGTHEEALDLYGWNGQISAAFMLPLHICEVSVRNAAHDAIAAEHGPQWPWNQGFLRSLPDPGVGYSPRGDVIRARLGKTSAGQIIPELKFMFWQKIFTKRHDARLWNAHLFRLFPNHPTGVSVEKLREHIYNSLEAIRLLRNRIAHHEPIFRRNLQAEMSQIENILQLRSLDIADWMMSLENVSGLLGQKPVTK